MSLQQSLQITLRDCSVQAGGKSILRVSDWSLRRGERWLLEGANGSGKSALLRLLAGVEWPRPEGSGHERRRYHFDGGSGWSPLPALKRVALLSPELQNGYLAQDWELTAAEVVATGFENTKILHRRPERDQLEVLQTMLRRLGLEEEADRPFLELSQGARRKVLIARSLVRGPEVLLLDEFLEGLDAPAQERFAVLLGRASMDDTSIVLTTHRPLRPAMAGWRRLSIIDGEVREVSGPAAGRGNSPPDAAEWLRGWKPCRGHRTSAARLQVSIRRGTLYAGERLLLDDLNWDIAAGEHWVLSGANGSGKTSLLRMLWGDLHLALGGEMRRFGRANLTVHQIRKRSGFFLPDFHAKVPSHQTGFEVILSGFFASLGLMDRPSAAQRESANKLIEDLQVEALADRPLGEMSYGQARRLLLARALVHEPEVVLLDEPFDGLDRLSRALVADILTRVAARDGVTVVMSSHHVEDRPTWIRRAALLRRGRLYFYERREPSGKR